MAKMTNIADHTLKVKISTMPGQPPMVTELAPGESAQFPDGYCKPVRSAGAAMLPCILSRANCHLGVPVLVPEDEAEAARARYERVKAGKAGMDPGQQIADLKAKLAAAEQVAKMTAPTPTPKAKVNRETIAAAPAPLPEEADDDGMTPMAAPKKRKRGKA